MTWGVILALTKEVKKNVTPLTGLVLVYSGFCTAWKHISLLSCQDTFNIVIEMSYWRKGLAGRKCSCPLIISQSWEEMSCLLLCVCVWTKTCYCILNIPMNHLPIYFWALLVKVKSKGKCFLREEPRKKQRFEWSSDAFLMDTKLSQLHPAWILL